MAKAQLNNKDKKRQRKNSCSYRNTNNGRVLDEFLSGRKSNNTTLNSMSRTAIGPSGRSYYPGNNRLHSTMGPTQRMGDKSSSSLLLGGLISLPPPRGRIASIKYAEQPSKNKANSGLALNQKLKHLRGILKLAMSAVLPLHMSTLEKKECSDVGSRWHNLHDAECL